MIDRLSLKQFLSGRLLALAVLLGFQVLVVRLLPPPEYARYAVAISCAALLQTLAALGLPRVSAKLLSGAGERLTRPAARRLALWLLGVRLAACLALLAPAAVVLSLTAAWLWPLFVAGAAYATASALQMDADGMAQALRLQVASRRAAVGEPLVRLGGVAALAVLFGLHAALPLLWLSACTAIFAAALLIGAVLTDLSQGEDAPGAARRLDWVEIRRIAIGGYSGTLSWLAFSPPVVRLIAARVLPVEAFAGFSFVQTLVASVQRYAPSFTLFPLIEPAVMAETARRGDADRLRSVLSLLVKIDAVAVGAAIVGAAAAGAPVVLLLTHGRYGAAAAWLPWLLLGVVANASHRAYEVAAIALDVSGALTRALWLTAAWLVFTLATAPVLGVWPLLLCPLGDALTRLWLVQRALTKRGVGDIIDAKRLGVVTGLAGGLWIAAAEVTHALHAGLTGGLATGSLGAATFIGLVAALGLFRRREMSPLSFAAEAPTHLRVAVLAPRGPGGTGGVDRLMDALRPRLAERADVAATFITTRGARRWLSPLVSAAALVKLAAASLLGRIDVIHVNLGAHGGCYRKMILTAIPRALGTPYVVHLHGSAFGRFWARSLVRPLINRFFCDAAQVIVLGEAWRRLVSHHVPEASRRTVVMPNASEPFLEPRTSVGNVVQVLFLGELGMRKGSTNLIEALSRLQTSTPWRAVIAGDGEVEQARRRVDALGLANRVSAPGWVGPSEVEALLGASHILVLPSLEENLPMAVIEAFAAGLAVIATPVGAVPDILRDGETGLLVQPGDIDGLTRALENLIDDAVLRRRIGDASKAYHRQRLHLMPYTEKLIQLWNNSRTNAL